MDPKPNHVFSQYDRWRAEYDKLSSTSTSEASFNSETPAILWFSLVQKINLGECRKLSIKDECGPYGRSNIECDWPGCKKSFTSEQFLRQHRRFHIRKSHYQCPNCSQRLLNRQDWLEHLAKCQYQQSSLEYRENRIQNEDDDKVRQQKILMEKLLSLSEGNLTNSWEELDLKMALSVDCDQANQTSADDPNGKRTPYSGPGRFRCPWPRCGYMPHFFRDLRRHMNKHSNQKVYKCQHCPFVSSWKLSLLKHRRRKHSSEEDFGTNSTRIVSNQ